MATQLLFFALAALTALDGFFTLSMARSNESVIVGHLSFLISAVLFSALALIIKADEIKKELKRELRSRR